MDLDFYIASAGLSIFGGVLHAISVEWLLPPFRLTTKDQAIGSLSLALLFWSTWMLPQAVLLASTNRPLFVIAVLTVMFLFYLLGVGLATLLLGVRRNLREKRIGKNP